MPAASPGTMHAIVLHEFGPAENLRYEEFAAPLPAEGQVRIAVEAAGVHLLDTTLRAGDTNGPMPPGELPMIPGREVAGIVESLGPAVEPEWLGKRVVAHLGFASSGYAEMAVAPVASLHEVPPGLNAAAAVAMIGTGRTAMLLLDDARITSGDVVLVTSAAGGLGSLLVQAARNAGAIVIGVAGGEDKRRLVQSLGENVIAIDYSKPDWSESVRESLAGRGISLVLDGVGGAAGREAFELLGEGGRLLIYGWSAGEPTDFTSRELVERRLSVRMFQRPTNLRDLETRSLAAAAAGELLPLVQRFALHDAAQAHAALEQRRTTGKVVLIP